MSDMRVLSSKVSDTLKAAVAEEYLGNEWVRYEGVCLVRLAVGPHRQMLALPQAPRLPHRRVPCWNCTGTCTHK